jgi:hypothetical protein
LVSSQEIIVQGVSNAVNSQLVVASSNKGNTAEGQVTNDSSTLVMFGNTSNGVVVPSSLSANLFSFALNKVTDEVPSGILPRPSIPVLESVTQQAFVEHVVMQNCPFSGSAVQSSRHQKPVQKCVDHNVNSAVLGVNSILQPGFVAHVDAHNVP